MIKPKCLKKGDRIVFLGDSITQAGERPGGYIRVVREFLETRHAQLELKVIGAGISGHKVPDLEKRLPIFRKEDMILTSVAVIPSDRDLLQGHLSNGLMIFTKCSLTRILMLLSVPGAAMAPIVFSHYWIMITSGIIQKYSWDTAISPGILHPSPKRQVSLPSMVLCWPATKKGW